MKTISALIYFLSVLGTVAASSDPKVDYRAELKREAFPGGPEAKSRLKAVIQPLFRSGVTKEDTIAILFSTFQLTEKDLNFSSIQKTPLKLTIDGQPNEVSSWISTTLLSFRALRTLGAKNYIGAQFDFDKDNRLLGFTVSVDYGPDL